MYEVVQDIQDDGSNLQPHLLFAIVLVATLSCEDLECASIYSHIFKDSQAMVSEHFQKVLGFLESMFIQCYKEVYAEEEAATPLDLSTCQAIFIYYVYCKTQSKSVDIISGNHCAHMADMLTKSSSHRSSTESEEMAHVRL